VRELLRAHGAWWSISILTHPHLDHAAGFEQILGLPGDGIVGAVSPYVDSPDSWVWSRDAEWLAKEGSVEHAMAGIHDYWERFPERKWALKAGDERAIGDARILALYPDEDALKGLDPSVRSVANQWSSPLLLEWRGVRLLLGAYLENAGWQRIDDAGLGKPLGRHIAYKVAHHGSKGACHACHATGRSGTERVWPLTPWNRGQKLPRFEDNEGLSLLLDEQPFVYATSLPFSWARPTSGDPTRAELRDAGKPTGNPFAGVPVPSPADADKAWWHFAFRADGSLGASERGEAALRVLR